MINSIANASSSGSKSGSTPTVAASGQQSSVPTPRRNSTATEAGEHSPQQQKMPNSRPSSAVFNKEYTGSKEVSEVIRAILNVDPSISWYVNAIYLNIHLFIHIRAVFNYERGNLVTETCGNGDFDTFRNSFKDDGVSYGYLRTAIGVERRTKFVFFKWVGENAKPLQRARAFDGTKKALDLIRVIHLELPVSKHSDLVEKTIWDRLTMAAGANYDKEQNTVSQNTKNVTGSDLHSYKLHSKQFFENIEKSGTIKSVIYESKPLAKTTPVNLGVRSSASPVSIRNETNSDYGNRKTFYRDSFISSN
jgi:hypothetical protein